MASRGKEAEGPNHANSRATSPVNCAASCEPVRIRPGTMVVAVMPVPASSAASAVMTTAS